MTKKKFIYRFLFTLLEVIALAIAFSPIIISVVMVRTTKNLDYVLIMLGGIITFPALFLFLNSIENKMGIK